jgi:hypothetical protein
VPGVQDSGTSVVGETSSTMYGTAARLVHVAVDGSMDAATTCLRFCTGSTGQGVRYQFMFCQNKVMSAPAHMCHRTRASNALLRLLRPCYPQHPYACRRGWVC